MPTRLVALLGNRFVQLDAMTRVPVSALAAPAAPAAPSAPSAPELTSTQRARAADQVSAAVQTLLYSARAIAQLDRIEVRAGAAWSCADLELSPRAKVALQQRGFFSPQGPWRHCTVAQLVREAGLGARLLLAFLLALEKKEREADPATTAPEAARPAVLEDQLQAYTSACLYDSRSAQIWVRVHGWDGRGCRTLAQVATQYGVGQERVRQILAMSSSALRCARLAAPAPLELTDAVSLLKCAAPLSFTAAARLLKRTGASAVDFDAAGVLDAAEFFGVAGGLQAVRTPGGERLLICASHRAPATALVAMARTLEQQIGLISADWLWLHACQAGLTVHGADALVALNTARGFRPIGPPASPDGLPRWFWVQRSRCSAGAAAQRLRSSARQGDDSASALASLLDEVASRVLRLPSPIPHDIAAALLGAWRLQSDASESDPS